MVTVSIVTYKHNIEDIDRLLQVIKNSNIVSKIFIIDNSPSNDLQQQLKCYKCEYIFLNRNSGFGAGHNIAFEKAINQKVEYHFVINPDIFLESNVINNIVEFMDQNHEVGLLMPKILYPDGSIQYLPKLLPQPFDLLIRRLNILSKVFSKRLNNYELKQFSDSSSFEAPVISGCFSCFRIDALPITGLYDERFFMYFEDFDLSRRINKHFKTFYYSDVHVFHEYERGAQKSFALFKIYVISAIKYFNKWGWFFDHERRIVNETALENLRISKNEK